MDQTIRMAIFNNVKHRQIIYLKFGDKSFTSSTLFGLEPVSAWQSNFHKMWIFVTAIII